MATYKKLNKSTIYLRDKATFSVDESKIIGFCGGKKVFEDHPIFRKKFLDSLNTDITVGLTKRKIKEKSLLGVNANSINAEVRNCLKLIDNIEFETSVYYGTFLSQNVKSDFDFSIIDKDSNYYNLWNYCYGLEARVKGTEVFEQLIINNNKLEDWKNHMSKYDNDDFKYKQDLIVPDYTFNVIGEIQFGNWAMIYKDMFRLVTAINKNAKIDLYIYICANESISDLISDGTVTYKKAVDEFKENVDNHNINKPIIIIPLDINLSVSEEERVDLIQKYDNFKNKIDKYNKCINRLYELKKELKSADADILKIKRDIKNKEKQASKLEIEIKNEGVIINDKNNNE